MYIYVYIYIYIIYMKTVNVKTTSVLISILLHTEDCVYRAVSKRCLFSLRVKNSHCIQKKKKVNKDTTIVLEVCSPWILTRFRWERGPGLRWGGWEWRRRFSGAQGQPKDFNCYPLGRNKTGPCCVDTHPTTHTSCSPRVSGCDGDPRLPQAWERESPDRVGEVRPTAPTNGDTRLWLLSQQILQVMETSSHVTLGTQG